MLRLPILRASVLPLQHRHLFYTAARGLAEVDMPVVVAAGSGLVVEVENVAEAGHIVEEVLEAVLEEAARVPGKWESALQGDVLLKRDEVVVLVVGLFVRCKSLAHLERS